MISLILRQFTLITPFFPKRPVLERKDLLQDSSFNSCLPLRRESKILNINDRVPFPERVIFC